VLDRTVAEVIVNKILFSTLVTLHTKIIETTQKDLLEFMSRIMAACIYCELIRRLLVIIGLARPESAREICLGDDKYQMRNVMEAVCVSKKTSFDPARHNQNGRQLV
jgi:hypothetical protein